MTLLSPSTALQLAAVELVRTGGLDREQLEPGAIERWLLSAVDTLAGPSRPSDFVGRARPGMALWAGAAWRGADADLAQRLRHQLGTCDASGHLAVLMGKLDAAWVGVAGGSDGHAPAWDQPPFPALTPAPIS